MSAEKETERAVEFTPHQIACVRKYCDDYAEGIEGWTGCIFPAGQNDKYPCLDHSPCREEILGGLRMARLTTPTAPLQESANPSPPHADQLQGAEAPPPELQEDTAHHVAGTRGTGVGETVGSLPPVAPTTPETNSNE